MWRLAILGATSLIAKDLIRALGRSDRELSLFSRRPAELAAWIRTEGLPDRTRSFGYDRFPDGAFDAIINFVGAGDPARIADMGSAILEITQAYDDLALDYLCRHPQTRYLFMSSGATYGPTFPHPVGPDTPAEIPINNLSATDFYSVAKLYAECRHRAAAWASIIDIRIFNYFSRTSDIAARFFMTEIVRSIVDGVALQVGAETMRRDFLAPVDFAELVDCALRAAPANMAVDAYSKAPLEKFELLNHMRDNFGLDFEIAPAAPVIEATGAKPEYFSENRRAETLGYRPSLSSIEGVTLETKALLDGLARTGAR